MRTPTRLVMLLALLVGSIGSIAATDDTQTPEATEATATTDTLHLRQTGDGCPGTTFLSTTPGTEDGNCGYIGGGPFGEVFETAEVDTSTEYPDADLGTVVLDGARDLATTITIGSYDGVSGPGDMAGGVGQVRVVGAISADVDGSRTTLHSFDVTELTNPAEDVHTFELTADIDDALTGLDADGFRLELTVRGVHVGHGFVEVNGASFIDIPTLQPAETSDDSTETGEA